MLHKYEICATLRYNINMNTLKITNNSNDYPDLSIFVCGMMVCEPDMSYGGILSEDTKVRNIYGYVRVSSADQNEARQMIAMREQEVPEKNIYIDKQSGKDFNRPNYRKLLRKLRKDDLLYIKSIDRLGRDYAEIQEQWQYIVKTKKANIVVLDNPLLDTRRGRDLIGTFLSDIVLQVLSFVAENERNNIRQRQAEGIAAARERGVKFGRPPKPLPASFEQAYTLWNKGVLSVRKAAAFCGITPGTFYYHARKRKEN